MTTQDDAGQLPEVVVLPTMTAPVHGQEAQLALRRTTDGELITVAYSSLDQLLAAAGEQQSWVAVPAADLPAVLAGSGVRRVLLDVPLPQQALADA